MEGSHIVSKNIQKKNEYSKIILAYSKSTPIVYFAVLYTFSTNIMGCFLNRIEGVHMRSCSGGPSLFPHLIH